jgi:hypothetical protein
LLGRNEITCRQANGFLGGMLHHPAYQTRDTPWRCGRCLFTLFPFLRFGLTPFAFLGTKMFVMGSPKTFEEVVEGADTGNVTHVKPTEDGVKR